MRNCLRLSGGLLLCSSTMIAVAQSEPCQSFYAHQAAFKAAEILPLAERRDFAGLEAKRRQFLTTDKQGALGSWKLESFYWAVHEGPHPYDIAHGEDHKKFLSDWRRAIPGSTAPSVIEGMDLDAQAWNVRGNSPGYGVSQDAHSTFRSLVQQTWDLLMPLAKKKVSDPHLYSVMIEASKGLSLPREEVYAIYRLGIEVEPAYISLHSRMLEKLLPKWGGTIEEYAKVAKEAADRVGGVDGDILYFNFAVLAAHGERSAALMRVLDVERIWRGAAALAAKYPGFSVVAHKKAIAALYLSDWPRAQAAFKESASCWDLDGERIWRSRAYFEKMRLRAVMQIDPPILG